MDARINTVDRRLVADLEVADELGVCLKPPIMPTNRRPNKLRSSSAAGHSGLFTDVKRSWMKFSKSGR